jgi:hypothetical protein
MVKEDERPDHAPLHEGQDTAHFKAAAQVMRASVYDEIDHGPILSRGNVRSIRRSDTRRGGATSPWMEGRFPKAAEAAFATLNAVGDFVDKPVISAGPDFSRPCQCPGAGRHFGREPTKGAPL